MSRTLSRSYIFVQWNLLLNFIGTHRRSKDLVCLHLSTTACDGLGGSAYTMSDRFKLRIFTPSVEYFQASKFGGFSKPNIHLVK